MSLSTKDKRLMEEYVGLDAAAKQAAARMKEIRELVDFDYLIQKNGEVVTEATSRIVFGDFEIQRQSKGGGPKLDEEAALAMVQKKYPKLKDVVKLVPTLDIDAFAKAGIEKKISNADIKSCMLDTKPTIAIAVKAHKKEEKVEL